MGNSSGLACLQGHGRKRWNGSRTWHIICCRQSRDHALSECLGEIDGDRGVEREHKVQSALQVPLLHALRNHLPRATCILLSASYTDCAPKADPTRGIPSLITLNSCFALSPEEVAPPSMHSSWHHEVEKGQKQHMPPGAA